MSEQLPSDSLLTLSKEDRLMQLLIDLGVWKPTELLADLTVAAKVIDELRRDNASYASAHKTLLEERESFRQQAEINANTIREQALAIVDLQAELDEFWNHEAQQS